MRRNTQNSLVKLRGKIYFENFTVRGHRFRGSLGTDHEETAEILAAERKKNALLGNLITRKPEMRLTEAFGRIWLEHSQFLPSSNNPRRRAIFLEKYLGKDLLLSQITPAYLVAYAAKRRMECSPATVNGDLHFLAQVLKRAEDVWDVAVAKVKIRKILLTEPKNRQRILTVEEEDRLFMALRPDMHGMVRFALLTGLRLANVIYLKWEQIDWAAGQIVFRTKSEDPDGKLHQLPITDVIREILLDHQGHHAEYVFTMVALKDHTNKWTGAKFVKGVRYPFTRSEAWRKDWETALTAAGLRETKGSRQNFRFHDLRHTAATRTLRATHNLRVVQELLGHANIGMTARYASADNDDVRAALELVEKTQSSHTGPVDPENF